MTRKVSPLYVKPDQVRKTFGGLSLNSQFKVSLHFGQAPKNSGNADTDTLVGHLNNCGVFDRGKLKSTADGFDFYALAIYNWLLIWYSQDKFFNKNFTISPTSSPSNLVPFNRPIIYIDDPI